jgi:hypothetical protein
MILSIIIACPLEIDEISKNTKYKSFSNTILDGISLFIILQKI